MKKNTLALIVAGLLPLGACQGDGAEQDLGEGIETQPAAEAETGVTEEVGFATWDTDTDQQLARNEWDSWYQDQDLSGAWNTDNETGLTEEEFSGGVFTAWDTDRDESLTETEWNEGTGTWFGDEEYGTWGEWDANGDSALDANEVTEGFERNNLYDTVDRDSDALIDDEEIADWWFDIWDGNDDEFIDTTEWDEVGAEWSRIGSGV